MDDARQDSRTKKNEADEQRRTEKRDYVYELSKIMKMPKVPEKNVFKEAVWCLRQANEARQSMELDDDERPIKRKDLSKDSKRRHEESDSISEMKILMKLPLKTTKNETLDKVLEFFTRAEITTIIEFPEMYGTLHKFDEHCELLDTDGRIEMIAGYTVSEVLEKSAFDFIHADDVPYVKIDLNRMSLKRYGDTFYRLKIKGDDEKYIYLKTSGQVVNLPNKKGIVTTFAYINVLLTEKEGLVAIKKRQSKYSAWHGKVERNDDMVIEELVADTDLWDELHQQTSGTEPSNDGSSIATNSVPDQLFSDIEISL